MHRIPGNRDVANIETSDMVRMRAEVEPIEKTASADIKSPKEATDFILLTRGNFESFVLRCFQGESCRYQDALPYYQKSLHECLS